MFDLAVSSPVWLGLIALTGAAAVTDARSGIIPNGLTLPCIAGAPIVHGIFTGPTAALASIVGVGICALVPWVFFVKGAMGGGDVKLFAAIGALLGPRLGLSIEIAGFVATAVYAMGVLAWRGQLCATLKRSLGLVMGRMLPASKRAPAGDSMEPVRMGVPVFLGTAIWAFAIAVGAVG